MITRTKSAEAALPHLVHVLDALEEIKRHADEHTDILDDPTWAVASDALTDLRDAMFKLGVPGSLIHDFPERLPRS